MINEVELNTIKSVLHSLNNVGGSDLAFDVKIIDSNGETLGRLERTDEEYQLMLGDA